MTARVPLQLRGRASARVRVRVRVPVRALKPSLFRFASGPSLIPVRVGVRVRKL